MSTDPNKMVVRVYVGFSWQKAIDDCTKDKRWSSIKDFFKKTNDFLAKRYSVDIDFRRLRASHGRFIWESIREKIAGADILLFDVADVPRKMPNDGAEIKYKGCNRNVLLELGAALAKDKPRVFILCPKRLIGELPSDINGLFYSEYTDKMSAGVVKRTYSDKWGILPQYRSLVAEVVSDKGWDVTANEDDTPQEEVEGENLGKGA